MQQIKILIITLFLIMVTGCGKNKSSAIEKLPSFIDQSGKLINLSDYKGKWLIINFWASWCSPCRQEIPQLNKFFKQHHEKDAEIIGVNIDPMDGAKLTMLIKDFAIEYPVTTSNLAEKLNIDIQFMPTTLFINPKGVLVKSEVKEQTLKSLESMLS